MGKHIRKVNKKHFLYGSSFFLISVVFLAFNLRSSITAVGPIISLIRESTQMSNTAIGMLTTLPVLAFGLFSVVAPKLGRAYGNERMVFAALVTLTIGILVRSIGFTATLFIGTALLGLGIAICNVLIIGIIKDRFPEKMGMMTGVYTAAMNTMAAFASGVSIPLALGLQLGWEKSLAVWAISSSVALLLWLPQVRSANGKKKETEASDNGVVWRSPISWQVTLYMGFQSSIFYCMIAWLPEILISQGISIQAAGWMLTLMQLTGLPTSLLIPMMAVRLPNQRRIVFSIALFYFIAFTGIYYSGANLLLVTFWIILLGLAQGAGISLALTLFGLRTKTGAHASELSGMAQAGGYLLAAVGPFFMGFLYDTFGSWKLPYVLFFIFIFALLIFGQLAARDRYVSVEQTRIRA